MALLALLVPIGVLIVVIGIFAARSATKPGARRRVVVITAVALLIVTSPISVIWAMLAVAAVGCGGLPVTANRFAAAYSYSVPGDFGYNEGAWPLIVPDYYCSASEAEAAGFHRT